MKMSYFLIGLVFLVAVMPQMGFAQGFCLWSYSSGQSICNTNSGNVAIGTNTPESGRELTVYKNGDWADVCVRSSLSDSFDFGTGDDGHYVYGSGAYPIYFATNASERMRIDSSGNVGIGALAPDSKLEIVGEADRITPILHVEMGDSHDADVLLVDTFEEEPLFVIDKNGKTGVGVTSPVRTLHVKDILRLEPQSSAPSGGKGDLYAGTDGKLYFHNGSDWQEVAFEP